ncbi:hypothetical protein niasHT_024243 [Heterodera trifolii]|uniref:FIT family protein n=1 Tax=Heterodera trifolii TaxID=157864 RepID=A0ABD2JM19_9BILA
MDANSSTDVDLRKQHSNGNGNVRHQAEENGTEQQQNNGRNFLQAPTSFHDVVLGVLTQLSRKYLFIDAKKKALFYLAMVIVLSLLSHAINLPSGYLTQKHNVFNQFGTKLGWFWTLLLLTPFIWSTSLLHHESKLKAGFDLFRLLVATALWYTFTNCFVKFELHTGKCHGSVESARVNCYENGGKWIPGFDISGHAFLLIYSILIICEESTSFQNWPSKPRATIHHVPSRKEFELFQRNTKIIQWLFVSLMLLHLLWDSQLLITSLYYHEFWQKLIGAIIGVFSWFVTYRFWFVVGFPFLPIRRHIKSF